METTYFFKGLKEHHQLDRILEYLPSKDINNFCATHWWAANNVVMHSDEKIVPPDSRAFRYDVVIRNLFIHNIVTPLSLNLIAGHFSSRKVTVVCRRYILLFNFKENHMFRPS
jgi:hypothetical protein